MKQNNRIAGKPALATLAIIVWTGLLLQFYLSLNLALLNGKSVVAGLVVFFGYFTVLSNLFVALVSTLPLVASSSRLGQWFAKPGVLGCATTSILLVGLGYHLLLRNVWAPQGLQLLADVVLHYVVPFATLAYWLAYPPRPKLGAWVPFAWCLYPVGYLVYALLRGEVLGSYPYPFIDVTTFGYGRVALNALGLLVAFLLGGAVVVAIARVRNRFRLAV